MYELVPLFFEFCLQLYFMKRTQYPQEIIAVNDYLDCISDIVMKYFLNFRQFVGFNNLKYFPVSFLLGSIFWISMTCFIWFLPDILLCNEYDLLKTRLVLLEINILHC